MATPSFLFSFDPLHRDVCGHISSHVLYCFKNGRPHSCIRNTSDSWENKKDKTLWALTLGFTLLTFMVEKVSVIRMVKNNRCDILLKTYKDIKKAVKTVRPFLVNRTLPSSQRVKSEGFELCSPFVLWALASAAWLRQDLKL